MNMKFNLQEKKFIATAALEVFKIGGNANLESYIEWYKSYGVAVRPRYNNAGRIVGMFCDNYVL